MIVFHPVVIAGSRHDHLLLDASRVHGHISSHIDKNITTENTVRVGTALTVALPVSTVAYLREALQGSLASRTRSRSVRIDRTLKVNHSLPLAALLLGSFNE